MKTLQPKWIAPGDSVVVAGIAIPGMIYCGEYLKSICCDVIEPSLIVPTASISGNEQEDSAYIKGYWGSYSKIGPKKRHRYLQWLEGGRRKKGVSIGYVFLFFYGLERRVLHDICFAGCCNEELQIIADEIKQLLKLYRGEISFDERASNFLKYIFCLIASRSRSEDEVLLCLLNVDKLVALKFRLGSFGVKKLPVPSDVAYEWLLKCADKNILNIIKAFTDKFKEIFEVKYNNVNEHWVILPTEMEYVTQKYKPSSSSFDCNCEMAVSIKVPVGIKTTVFSKELNALAIRVCSEIGFINLTFEDLGFGPRDYSKYRSKDALTLGAFVEQFSDITACVQIDASELLKILFVTKIRKLTNIEVELLVLELAKYNLGIEPDGRYCRHLIDPRQVLILFPLVYSPVQGTSPSYKLATTFIETALAISGFGENNINSLAQFIKYSDEIVPFFSANARERLNAYLCFIANNFDNLKDPESYIFRMLRRDRCILRFLCFKYFVFTGGIDKASVDKFVEFFFFGKEKTASLLVGICTKILKNNSSDKFKEMKVCKNATDLQTRPREFYTDPDYIASDEEVLTQSEEQFLKGLLDLSQKTNYNSKFHKQDVHLTFTFSLNNNKRQPLTASGAKSPLKKNLDNELIAEKFSQSETIASFLDSIFNDEEEISVFSVPSQHDQHDAACDFLLGLDQAHTRFLRQLLAHGAWKRQDFDCLAKELGLMPEGAIESINEAAFEKFNTTIIDADGDPLLIDITLIEGVGVVHDVRPNND